MSSTGRLRVSVTTAVLEPPAFPGEVWCWGRFDGDFDCCGFMALGGVPVGGRIILANVCDRPGMGGLLGTPFEARTAASGGRGRLNISGSPVTAAGTAPVDSGDDTKVR